MDIDNNWFIPVFAGINDKVGINWQTDKNLMHDFEYVIK